MDKDIVDNKLMRTTDCVSRQRVLVTGGSGFLGSHLCDRLIVSGGGQLDDYFGGPWRGQPLTLLIWGLFAKIRRVEYLFVSVGAGPLDSWLSRLFIKQALSLASYRSYRDDDSKNYLAKVVGFKGDDPVYPDLAHSLEIAHYQELAAFQKVS